MKTIKLTFRSQMYLCVFFMLSGMTAASQNNLVLADPHLKWVGDGNVKFVLDDLGIQNDASQSVFNGTGNFRFLGASLSAVSGSFSTMLPDVEIAKSGSEALELNRNLTVNEHVLISSGALKINDQTLSIGRNFTNHGSFYSGPNGQVVFSGINNSLVTMNNNFDLFTNLKVNKTSGAELKLGSSIQVSGQVLFDSGNLYLNNWGLDLGTTGLLMNETNQSRIYCDCPVGFVRAVRPVGATGTFNPGNLGMEITTTGIALGNTEIKRRHSLVDLSGNFPSSVYRYFEVDPEFNQNFNATVKFRYLDGEVSALVPNPVMDLYRSTDQGGNWIAQDALHDITGNTITKSGLPGFSWFAAGLAVGPLPVTLTKFEAVCAQQVVELAWTTESETNNLHFRVERSENLMEWTEVSVVSGGGNSNQPLHYHVTDARPLNGLAYYRLIQQDFDGTTEVFDPISVECYSASEGNSLMVYPNPVCDYFTISVHSSEDEAYVELQIADLNGKPIKTRKVILAGGANEFVLDRFDLNPGSYLVRVLSTKMNLNPVKLIVK